MEPVRDYPVLAWITLAVGGLLLAGSIIGSWTRPSSGSIVGWDPTDRRIQTGPTYVTIVDSIQLTEQQRTEVLTRLTGVMGTLLNGNLSTQLSYEGMRTQTRYFFVFMLVALIGGPTLVRIVEINQKQRRWWFFGALVLTGFMFLLDLHMADVIKRHNFAGLVMNRTYHELASVKPADHSWRRFDDSKIQEEINENSEWCPRWQRQIQQALHPEAAQIVIFSVPFSVICLLLFFDLRKHEASSAATGSPA